MSDELLDTLKIKPLPKKVTEYNFFIESQNVGQIPVVDKTGENLVDPLEFMSKITDKLNIVNKNTNYTKQPKSVSVEAANFDYLKSVKQVKSMDKLTDIVKTNKKIIIKELIHHKPFEETGLPELPSQKRITPKPQKTIQKTIDETVNIDGEFKLGDTKYKDRVPKHKPNIIIKAPDYYLYNREKFISFINALFLPYKEQLLQEEKDIADGKIHIGCDQSQQKDVSLFIHQQIVRDYINLYTPYRGLLLYHGLGSGKTCSSIAITEGIKNDKEVIVMTPASLKDNYIGELKKCGDYLYKKNQYWEFINTTTNPEYLKPISSIMKLPEEYIKKNNGAWFINVTKQSNYDSLHFDDQQKINDQINTSQHPVDPYHSTYLGEEMMKAEIALKLGLAFVQDNDLDFSKIKIET